MGTVQALRKQGYLQNHGLNGRGLMFNGQGINRLLLIIEAEPDLS